MFMQDVQFEHYHILIFIVKTRHILTYIFLAFVVGEKLISVKLTASRDEPVKVRTKNAGMKTPGDYPATEKSL